MKEEISILVVDDESLMRNLVYKILDQGNYKVQLETLTAPEKSCMPVQKNTLPSPSRANSSPPRWRGLTSGFCPTCKGAMMGPLRQRRIRQCSVDSCSNHRSLVWGG